MSATEPAIPEQVEAPPPIQAYLRTFQLAADPAALHEAAGAIRRFGLQAIASQRTVQDAADQIESEEAWQGATADNYQSHRRRLTGDLGSLGYEAGHAADRLDEVADLLTWYQVALDNERAALDGIPQSAGAASPRGRGGPLVTYHPRTEEEASAITDALLRANELRNQLDESLALKESALRRTVEGYALPASLGGRAPGLAELARYWEPRALRHLNLNAGSGGAGDMEAIGGEIAREGADVVTLQEVYREDLDNLLRGLGGNWEVYYGHASNKRRGASPENWSESFGNVVLVRQGEGIGSRAVEEGDRIGLDAPGSNVDPDEAVTESVPAEAVPWEDSGDGDDGEGRSAAVAEVTIER
jgi:hypothetical protein